MDRKINLLVILFGGIILCFMGYYNGYPFVFSDTGTYLESGFLNFVPIDRPIIYGLFARHVSLSDSLWLIIWAQGCILSLMIYYYFKYFSNCFNKRIPFIIYVFLITFLTGASINVSQLIPDVFTSVSLLALGLLIFANNLSKRDFIIITFFLVLGTAVHNSHYYNIALILLFLSGAWVVKKLRNKMIFFSLKRLVYLWAILIFTNLSVCTVHASFGGGFFRLPWGARFFNVSAY